MSVSPARKSAFDVLLRVFRDKAHSSQLLDQEERELDERDARLCHEIVLGTIRQKLRIDNQLKKYLKKPLEKLDLEVVIALEMALFQLKVLDRIPVYSAIDDSVELVKRAKKRSASGFVNAILRKASRDLDDWGTNINTHPDWLMTSWCQELGEDRALGIALADDEPAPIVGRNTLKSADWNLLRPFFEEESIETIYAGDFVSFRLSRLDSNVRAKFADGEIYFQDLGSQMVAKLVTLKPGGRFLDVCAAPGGKTSLVELLNRRSKNSFISGDLKFGRCKYLQKNLRNQGALAEIVCYDASDALPFHSSTFDSVLVDAPCSGTGTIRSNPEIRFNIDQSDILELSCKQLKILKQASNVVKLGGQLIYSTCSLQIEENESVVENFLAETPNFELRASNSFPEFRTARGYIRTFPDRDGMDGFFAAEFERIL